MGKFFYFLGRGQRPEGRCTGQPWGRWEVKGERGLLAAGGGHTPPSALWADTSPNLGEEPRGGGRGKVGGVWEGCERDVRGM